MIKIRAVFPLVLALCLVLATGCSVDRQNSSSQNNNRETVNFAEVTEVFPAGEINRQIDTDIHPALEQVFGDTKLVNIFALQDKQPVKGEDNASLARHMVYIVPRTATEKDATSLAEQLYLTETANQVTSGVSGLVHTVSYLREVQGTSYRINIGIQLDSQQIGISVYPLQAEGTKQVQ